MVILIEPYQYSLATVANKYKILIITKQSSVFVGVITFLTLVTRLSSAYP
jgi:hypothetical protein